ncbi:dienelactone hydrolase family protein [Peribacillus alkalitolerans]|uniref:dienelactone hydrolase family protein n=1 Tax=Peribacillus alkalitolerans TaxID=1550385 RepID=UPI0013D74B06|nr:dienelactone hydrolase family protein [Peribacillus alkalitolerans]
MIKILNGSQTAIIVLHEIYGMNPHIKNFCEKISKENFDIFCPNLLDNETSFDYSQEEQAYHHFIENVGFYGAADKIRDFVKGLRDSYQKVFIIGFSVGATIAWLCSELEFVDGVIGFYGSRIRNYNDINPRCPILLFFPQVEKSFDVDELISRLVEKNISIYKLRGEHGFSDPYSSKYHAESDQITYRELLNFIKTH